MVARELLLTFCVASRFGVVGGVGLDVVDVRAPALFFTHLEFEKGKEC